MNWIILSSIIVCKLVVLSTGKRHSVFSIYVRKLKWKAVLATNLETCILSGDPHIHMFHPVDQSPPPYKDCLDEGTITAVRNSIVTILIDVHDWWMVDVCLHVLVINIDF